MPTVPVYDLEKKKVGDIDLSDAVFAAPVKEHLFHDVVRQQRAAWRSGTASVKNLSSVAGTSKKPFKQKGTGRARAGRVRAPNWRKGGVNFGPVPRDHGYSLTKKTRKAAMRSALSLRLAEGKLLVLEEVKLPRVKTRDLIAALGKLQVTNALFVDSPNVNLKMSARNIPSVAYAPIEGVGLVDVLRREHLILTRNAALRMNEAFK